MGGLGINIGLKAKRQQQSKLFLLLVSLDPKNTMFYLYIHLYYMLNHFINILAQWNHYDKSKPILYSKSNCSPSSSISTGIPEHLRLSLMSNGYLLPYPSLARWLAHKLSLLFWIHSQNYPQPSPTSSPGVFFFFIDSLTACQS